MKAKHSKYKANPRHLKQCQGSPLTRAAAFLAAVSMSLSMSVSAFAAEYWIGDGDITIEVDENGNHYVTQVDKDGNKKYDKQLDADGNVTIKGGSSTVAHEENDMVDDGFAVAAEEEAEQPEDDTNEADLPEDETEQPTEGTEGEDNADENGEEENKTPTKEGEEETTAEEPAFEEEAMSDEKTDAQNTDELSDEREPFEGPNGEEFFDYVIKIISDSLAKVTLDNVKINVDRSGSALQGDFNGRIGKAALSIEGKGDVELELDGDNELYSGTYRAGLEKRDDNSTGNLTIKDDSGEAGSLTVIGGAWAAGIGGFGDIRKDEYGNQYSDEASDTSNITITGGTVTANGGGCWWFSSRWGSSDVAQDATIWNVEYIVREDMNGGAGIGGGAGGNANNITITGGTVNATGTMNAAGIGGSGGGNANNIAITGGTVTATGSGVMKTASGKLFLGTANIAGSDYFGGGAGIGGGAMGNGSNITVSGDAKVTAIAGKKSYYGEGASIGNGGKKDGTTGEGGVDTADISGLYKGDADIDVSSDSYNGGYIHHIYANGEEYWEYGTLPRPEADTSGETAAAVTLPLHVENFFGTELDYTTVRDGGTLTLTVNDAFARLHGSLAAVRELQAQGVNTIVFVTSMQTTTVSVSDLLARGADGDEFALRHDDLLSTLAVGNEILPAPCAK